MKVSGKRVVVTGGALGIGAALVRQLAGMSCSVVIADYDAEAGEALAATLGDAAEFVRFDAADVSSVQAMADVAWSRAPVDLVFANAGVSTGAALLQATQEQFDWQFNVNVRGVWATAKAFATRMIDAGRDGHIILTGSEHSLGMQHTGIGLYTGTKHAVLGIADVLRNELPSSLKVSVLCPGIVATCLNDADRYGVLPPSAADVRAFGAIVMSKGMPADELAQKAIAGVEQDAFLIVSHPASIVAAERRYDEIRMAFEEQAPMNPDASKYEMNNVLAAAMAEAERRS